MRCAVRAQQRSSRAGGATSARTSVRGDAETGGWVAANRIGTRLWTREMPRQCTIRRGGGRRRSARSQISDAIERVFVVGLHLHEGSHLLLRVLELRGARLTHIMRWQRVLTALSIGNGRVFGTG